MAELELPYYESDKDDEIEVYNAPYMEGGNELEFQDGSQVPIYDSDAFDADSSPTVEYEQGTTEEIPYYESSEYDEVTPLAEEDYSSSEITNETEAMFYKSPSKNTYKPEDVVTKDFFMSQNAQTSIGMFMKSRYGASGIKQDDESKEEYAERFFNKMRWMQNNIASTGAGLSWLHGADELTKQNFGVLYRQFHDMPAFYEDGGGDALNGVLDSVFSVVADPTNVATLGIATGFKILGGRMAASTLLKSAINSNKGRIAGAASVEGILGAMQEGNIQSLEIEADLRTDKDWTTILAMGALSAGTTGAINFAVFKKGLRDDTYKEKVLKELDDKRKELGLTVEETSSAARTRATLPYDPANGPIDEQIKDVSTIFDAAMNINRQNADMDNVTRIDVSDFNDAKQVLAEIMSVMPSMQPVGTETITKAFHRAFVSLHMADDVLLKEIDERLIDVGLTQGRKGANFGEALSRLQGELDEQGIDFARFAAIADVDVSTAAKIMNMQSQLSKVINRMNKTGLTQEEDSAIAFAKKDDIQNASFAMQILSAGGGIIMKTDRIRRAIMTSQPATTARNIVSGTAAVTMAVASRMLHNTYKAVGNSANSVLGRDGANAPSFTGMYEGGYHIMADSLGIIGDVFSHGKNRELVDLVLEDNAILHHKLLRTTQEAGTNELPKVVLTLNALNIAQDQFLRTGVFMNSVKRQMSDLLQIDDVTEYLAKGNSIPVKIAQEAVDDALNITFANVPKNSFAKGMVEAVEKLPFVPVIGTGAFPFARFMANAISFQFRYSPTNFFGAALSKHASRSLKAAGSPGWQREQVKAARRFNDAIVGTGAIAAAVLYRYDKQDTTTYEEGLLEDGSTVSLGAVFPLPFYLMFGDMLVKGYNGNFSSLRSGDIMQAATGYQSNSSNVNYFLDNFIQTMSDAGIGVDGNVSNEKFADAFGKYTGELAGQFFTPTKIVRDVLAAFDEEQNLRKDANIVTSTGVGPRMMDSFVNKAVANLPTQLQDFFADKPLPAQESAVREEDQYNVAPLLTQLTGMKIIPARKGVENEMLKHGLKPYLLLSPSGDKQQDALIRRYMPKFIDEVMTPIIESEYYKQSTRAAQANIMADAKSMVIKYAKEVAQRDSSELRDTQGYSPEFRAKWGRIPRNKRKEVNERWFAEYGVSIEQAKAYEAGISLSKSIGL